MDTQVLNEGIRELERRNIDLRVANDFLSSVNSPRVVIQLQPYGEVKISHSDFITTGIKELLLDFLKSKVSNAEEAIKEAVNSES